MKTRTKVFLCLAVVAACLLGLAVVSSAATYTVGGASSDFATVKEAETAAQNGDIIVIEADVTSDINLTLNKSLEFVLGADLLGGFRVSYSTANPVTLTFRTQGTGNRTIKFSKSCDTSQGIFGGGYGNNLSTRFDVNFIGSEDSKIILDGSSYAHGLNGALKNLILSLTHTEIVNFRASNQSVIKCARLNVYKGTKIYNNTSTNNAFDLTNLYLYEGEICNNVSNGKYMFVLKNAYMYGGSIHDNYLANTAAVAFMAYEYGNANVYRFFDGCIYNNYLDSTASPKLIYSSTWNNVGLINRACVGNNYYYSSADATVQPTLIANNYNNLTLGEVEYTVVFKNADGTLISAYAKQKKPNTNSFVLTKK